MLYFFLIILLLSSLTLLESVDEKLIPPGTGIVVFVVLFLFACSRPIGADNDSATYLSMFGIVSVPSDYFNNFLLWGSLEPAYYFIPSILNYVYNVQDYSMVTLYIYAFLGCGIVMLALRKLTPFYYASLLTLFCNYFLLQQMTQIRAAVAVGFYLLCIRYRQQRRFGLFFLCLFMSLLFHYSTLLGISLLFFSGKTLNRKLYFGLAILSLVLSFVDFSWILSSLSFNAGALSGKQEAYVGDVQNELLNRRNYIFLVHFFNTLLLIAFSERLYALNKYTYLLIKVQVVALIFFQVLSASPVISERVFDYFMATHLVTLPACLYLFRFRLWPALALCVLNTAIFITLIYRNQIFDMSYYAFR